VALLLMKSGLVTDIVGIGGMGLICLIHWRWKKSQTGAMEQHPSQDAI